MRVDFEADKSWVILRKSNTEPIIRVYAEAPVEVVSQAIAEEILDIANEIL